MGYTIDVLSRNTMELIKYTHLPHTSIGHYVLNASRLIAPKSRTAFEMYSVTNQNSRGRFCRTLLKELDDVLQGGLPTGCITELVGPPGIGKTQLCLQLSVTATLLPNWEPCGEIIYIDTEGTFTAQRLVEIAKTRFGDVFKDKASLAHLANSIHIYTEITCEDLMGRLGVLKEMVDSRNIKLIVVDSIASLVRKEFDVRRNEGISKRSALLSKQASILKSIAESYGIPVVVTNQITRFIYDDPDWLEGENETMVTTALGNTWSHCVNTRLLLSYSGRNRNLMIVKSPIAPFYQLDYTIDTKGISINRPSNAEISTSQGQLMEI
ncbi:DNA repair protein RAD51 homolog 2-like isoform X2 [Dysidea avara]|uniref:DNA repair protein RAD51 homolog 2-like isoform X2 n=1 Tax=Dysidea avara TaxID=196820 RepID=UPI00331A86FA